MTQKISEEQQRSDETHSALELESDLLEIRRILLQAAGETHLIETINYFVEENSQWIDRDIIN